MRLMDYFYAFLGGSAFVFTGCNKCDGRFVTGDVPGIMISCSES